MRAIEGGSTQLRRIEKVIEIAFIPSMIGGITCNKDERMLIPCPSKLGGLGIRKLAESCQVDDEISVKLTQWICTKTNS